MLRLFGIGIEKSTISPGGFYGGRNITIGRGSFLNHNVFLDSAAQIVIGANCHFGMGVLVATSSHHIGPADKRAGDGFALPVVIGDGVWVGARATILPGVTIGPGCVIASGAVVVNNCEPDGVYAGVPAKRVRELGALA